MTAFIKRNIKNFFRDRGALLASFLTIIIIIGLYALFLGDVLSDDLDSAGIENSRYLTDSWIIAGLMAVAPLSASLGAVAIVGDRAKGIFKDFYCSPISRSKITAGYIISLAAISLLITVCGFVLGEVYIAANGGSLLSWLNMLKALGFIVLDDLAVTAMIMFLAMFITSEKAYSAICTVIGTIAGFIMGIYIPIGSLPDSVGTAIKCFPISHAGSMLRQIFMEDAFDTCFESVPKELAPDIIADVKESLGVYYTFGEHTVNTAESVIILVATAAVFFLLTVLASRKKAK